MLRLRRHRDRHGDVLPPVAAEPIVVPVNEPVTRDTAPEIVARVGRLASRSDVVIDLTGISALDTDGAAALIGLQESHVQGRVTFVGLRQATARLVGAEDVLAVRHPAAVSPWVLRRLRAIAVVQAIGEGPASTDELSAMLTAAMEEEVGIVVLDLRGALMTTNGIDIIAFASSSAAVRGQELLIVNADPGIAERLRQTGLSATTFVAPEPLGSS